MTRCGAALAIVVIAATAGCASTSDIECRNADWYGIGFRDALYGLQPQDAVYAQRCEGHGIGVDFGRYSQGWREGKWEFDSRERRM